MFKKLLAILLFIFLSDLAQAALEGAENDGLKKAITENDIAKFKAILKQAKEPFKVGFLSAKAEAVEHSTIELQYAIANSSGCKDEFIKELISYGFQPRIDTSSIRSGGKDLSIWQQLCPKTIEVLLPFFTDEDKAKIGSIVIQATSELATRAYGNQVVSENDLQNAVASMNLFSDKIKTECSTYDVKNGWCKLKDQVADIKNMALEKAKKIELEEKTAEYEDSPTGLTETVCDLNEQIKTAQAAIDRQKEIGKTSGFVDKEVLHVKGAIIVDLKTEIKNLKARYREKTKKAMIEKCN
ncbi:hypothetical protein K2P97_06840 [bacterium]|nr:hypothetical protein [bacterium]